jgi:hypothetical protein
MLFHVHWSSDMYQGAIGCRHFVGGRESSRANTSSHRKVQADWFSPISFEPIHFKPDTYHSHRVPTSPPLPLREGRQVEITPPPSGISEQYSQTISNLGHAALLRRCDLPLLMKVLN